MAKTKEIAALAKMNPSGSEPLSSFLRGFSSLMDCGVCLQGLDGSILFKSDDRLDGCSFVESKTSEEDGLTVVTLPVVCKGSQRGTMVIGKKDTFTDCDAVLADIASIFIAQELQYDYEKEKDQANRLQKTVRQSLEALSYSERTAFAKVLRELEGSEGVLVASKIAERDGIKRSAIVNAIRKLESSGIIESRSLGVKGTFIRIIHSEICTALEMDA